MLRLDELFNALQTYKLLKSWSNLRVDKDALVKFCQAEDSWYTLFVPEAELTVAGFADVQKQQSIMVQLLTDYTNRFYQALNWPMKASFTTLRT